MIIMFFIAVPLGMGAGIYLQEYAGEHFIVRLIKIAVSVLRGVPSIVFGLFALAFFVPIFGVSFLSGGLVLSFYALPMIIRTSTESLRSIPMGLREGSLALGATKWQTIKKIVIPPALPGILTGVVLGIGEAAGETAPIIFLSRLNGDALPSLFDTITALPMHLYSMFQYRGYGDAAQVAQRDLNTWATAFILLIIILMMNIVALILREKYRKEF
jgi:phosphate transport system permease protein